MAISLVSCQEYNIGLTASAIKAKKGEVKAPEPVRTDSSLPAKTAVQAGGRAVRPFFLEPSK